MADDRILGDIGTNIVFEDDRVRVWQLRLAPGEDSAVHRHELDHLLVQIAGDRVAVIPEPDTAGPYRDYLAADVIPGAVPCRAGRRRDGSQHRERAVPRGHHRAEGLSHGRRLQRKRRPAGWRLPRQRLCTSGTYRNHFCTNGGLDRVRRQGRIGRVTRGQR
jgi:hypothetical protein